MKPITTMLLITAAVTAELAMARMPGPPPEALQACSGKSIGSACSFNGRRGQLEGQCQQTPKGQTACKPEHRRGGGGQRGDHAGVQSGNGNPQQQSGRSGGRPSARTHTVTQSSGQLGLVASTQSPITVNRVSISEQGGQRIIQANGIAAHNTGAFPNAGNPNAISQQSNKYSVPMNPQLTGQTTEMRGHSFGVAVNGVPFDPGAAEVFEGAHDWHYEALSGAVALGVDTNFAHVQPTGTYHYHGKPTGLMNELGINPGRHSALVGWAADGFPIYALYGYLKGNNAGSGIVGVTSSYRLKQGLRPGGNEPGGNYDGTFVKDYQYVNGAGLLDECNGRMTVTPEFPNGTYGYFITETFPVIPRCFKGTPSRDFRKGIPGLR